MDRRDENRAAAWMRPREPGDQWCNWGRCTSNGVILSGSPFVKDEHGGPYHPGCRRAMERANA